MMDEPRFAQPIPNVTVAVGRDANLPCVVEHLGAYKVNRFRLHFQIFFFHADNSVANAHSCVLKGMDDACLLRQKRRWKCETRRQIVNLRNQDEPKLLKLFAYSFVRRPYQAVSPSKHFFAI